MKDKITIGGILDARNLTMIKMLGLRNEPGYAGAILTRLGDKNITLQFIAESEDAQGRGNMSICVKQDQAATALNIVQDIHRQQPGLIVEHIPHVCAISIYGPHFREKPAISGQFCSILGSEQINILGISTSISSVCCIIDDRDYNRALTRLKSTFQLP